MKYGYTFYDARQQRDIFIITNVKRRTTALAEKITAAVQEIDGNNGFQMQGVFYKPEKIYEVMQPATLEKRTLSNGMIYFNIEGDNFSCGTDILTPEEAETPEKYGLLIIKI